MGALVVDCPTHYGMQEVEVVGGFDNVGFDCSDT